MNTLRTFAAAALLGLITGVAFGQQARTLDGVAINFGLMPALQAVHAEGHREAHPAIFPSGSQHVLVTLAYAKTGRRIGDAQVLVEIVDPKGSVEKKALLHTTAAGMPDYSELFVFGWSGTYTVHITATHPSTPKPVETTFTVHHSL